MARTICATWFRLPRWVAALSPEPPKLRLCPSGSPSQWTGLPGSENFCSFTVPFPGHRSCLNSFFRLFFSFILPCYLVVFLAFLVVWNLSPALSRYFMRTVAHIHAQYFWCICGRRWALWPIPPSWAPPASILHSDLMVTWEYRRRKIHQDVHLKCMLCILLNVTVLISLP